MGESDYNEPSMSIEGLDDKSVATVDASAPGVSPEDGDCNNSDNGNNAGSGSAPDKGRRGASYRYVSGVYGQTVVAHPIITQKYKTPPSASHPLWRGVPHTKQTS